MHRHLRQPAYAGIPALLLLTVAFLTAATPAAAECDVGICPGDPCTITGTHTIDDNCTLAFGDRDVTLAPGASLELVGFAEISARNLIVQGKIQGKPLSANLTVTQDFRMEGRGRLLGKRLSENGSILGIAAGGDVTFDGAGVKLAGDWAYLSCEAGGAIRVDAPIKAQAYFGDFADLQFTGTSITTTAPLVASGRGLETGSGIFMGASGDVSVEKRLGLARDRFGGFGFEVRVDAGGDVTLPKMTFRSPARGGTLDVQAGGDITLLGNVSAKGFKASALNEGEGVGGQVSLRPGATGVVTIRGRNVNTSCGAGCDEPGSIEITTGCYTDLTGSRLSARIDGPISLGCSCIHPTGSNVCDGGCVGLDTATFDPPVPIALPPCS